MKGGSLPLMGIGNLAKPYLVDEAKELITPHGDRELLTDRVGVALHGALITPHGDRELSHGDVARVL